MRNTSLNKFIDNFNELSFDDREYAIELIKKQMIEARREKIFQRAKEAATNLRKGRVKKGTAVDLMRDLENDKNCLGSEL